MHSLPRYPGCPWLSLQLFLSHLNKRRKTVRVCFLHYSNALHTMDRQILLSTLSSGGVQPSTIEHLVVYLHCCHPCKVYRKTLFSAYISSMLVSNSPLLVKYADDI
ncbi:unnamed protein product, partial [Echinostoma caproni]|uniref:Secreted protein n=1 Tax=Echinostoma caproni TaxID=27848 RepID=A0A183BAK1_9TREM